MGQRMRANSRAEARRRLILAATRLAAPKVLASTNGHDWVEWVFHERTLICCDKCGLVRRDDDTNNPCKGRVKVALRSMEATKE